MGHHIRQSGQVRQSLQVAREDLAEARRKDGFWLGLLIGACSGFVLTAFVLGRLF